MSYISYSLNIRKKIKWVININRRYFKFIFVNIYAIEIVLDI